MAKNAKDPEGVAFPLDPKGQRSTTVFGKKVSRMRPSYSCKARCQGFKRILLACLCVVTFSTLLIQLKVYVSVYDLLAIPQTMFDLGLRGRPPPEFLLV